MAGNGDCPLMQKRLTEKPSTETKNGGCQIRRGGKQVLQVSARNLGYGHLKLSGFEAWGEAKELACQPDSRAARLGWRGLRPCPQITWTHSTTDSPSSSLLFLSVTFWQVLDGTATGLTMLLNKEVV